jgi:tRNA(Ile)-lysidine synthase
MTEGRAAGSLDACFAELDLAGRGAVIAAVSGGSDSTALLLLLKAHLENTAPATKLVAVTIDHGLRPDSAAEAISVGRLCADHGIVHRTLRWSSTKPATGLPAAAREARYRLLAEAAAALGTDIVLTGHTQDDQAETVSMRRRRGTGPGLAGMAPATLYDGKIWILRPLLRTSRAALRDFLRDIGVGWIDDPTNRNMAFERVRVREAGPGSADQTGPAAAARIAQARRAADLVTAHAALVSPGLIRLDAEFAASDDRAVAIHALRILLAVSGGTEHLPDLARATALFERLGEGPLCATLSRTVVDARRTGVFLYREQRGLPQPGPPRDGMIWDGRFRISGDGAGQIIGPLGTGRARLIDLPQIHAPETLMRAALAAWPAIWSGNEGLSKLDTAVCPPPGPLSAGLGNRGPTAMLVPTFPQTSKVEAPRDVTATPLLAPWARFLPCFDLAAAKTVAGLIGAPAIPAPPCEGHKGART